MANKPTLTTTGGAQVGDNQNSQTAGPRGPVMMQDYQLLEKLAHQNRDESPSEAFMLKAGALTAR